MRPLIYYYKNVCDTVVTTAKKINWSYVLKLAIVIIPVLIWTPFFFILDKVYKASSWFNEFGGGLLEEFFKK
jgi:hypothetical protein